MRFKVLVLQCVWVIICLYGWFVSSLCWLTCRTFAISCLIVLLLLLLLLLCNVTVIIIIIIVSVLTFFTHHLTTRIYAIVIHCSFYCRCCYCCFVALQFTLLLLVFNILMRLYVLCTLRIIFALSRCCIVLVLCAALKVVIILCEVLTVLFCSWHAYNKQKLVIKKTMLLP